VGLQNWLGIGTLITVNVQRIKFAGVGLSLRDGFGQAYALRGRPAAG
jgi:hypothetical protein